MKKWHEIWIAVSLFIIIIAIIILIDDRKFVVNILSLLFTAIIVWLANTYTPPRRFRKLITPLIENGIYSRAGFLVRPVKGTDIFYRLETYESTWMPGGKNFISINVIFPLPVNNAEDIFNQIENNFNKWFNRIKRNDRMESYCKLGFNKMFFAVMIRIPLKMVTQELLLETDRYLNSLISVYRLSGIHRYIKYTDESENYMIYKEYIDNYITRTVSSDNGELFFELNNADDGLKNIVTAEYGGNDGVISREEFESVWGQQGLL